MSVISVSANLDNTNANLIYKAQHDAIVLCDRVLTNTPDTTVSYIKRVPPNNDIALSDLQGVFLGRGSQLLAQASAICRVEITLMSRSSPLDYQVVYPPIAQANLISDSTIDTNVCGTCWDGNRVLEVSGNPGAQFAFSFASLGSDRVRNTPIKVIQWLAPPQCSPITEDIHYQEIGEITTEWTDFILNFVPPNLSLEISFLAQNNTSNAWELLCFNTAGDGDIMAVTFRGFPTPNS